MGNPERIPELIEEPADLDVWVMNRTEAFAALLREFKKAGESGRWHDCTSIAGMIGQFFGVITADLPVIVEREMEAHD